MTKIIWMSDPHFQAKGMIDGLDPRVRLDAAIDHASTHHADADFAVMTGDLVGDDVTGDYAAIAGYLARSAVPMYPIMGNNDERVAFRKHLMMPHDVMAGFVQYTLASEAGLFVFLDTHKAGTAVGELCEARLAWLDGVLAENAERDVYVFMHHPPLALGLPPQDALMLEDADAFLDLIGRNGNVRHLFMGHVHRVTSGAVRGIPFSTLGSLAFQAPQPRPVWDWDSFEAAKEAPQYGVILIEAGNVVVQYTQFCEYGVGVQTAEMA